MLLLGFTANMLQRHELKCVQNSNRNSCVVVFEISYGWGTSFSFLFRLPLPPGFCLWSNIWVSLGSMHLIMGNTVQCDFFQGDNVLGSVSFQTQWLRKLWKYTMVWKTSEALQEELLVTNLVTEQWASDLFCACGWFLLLNYYILTVYLMDTNVTWSSCYPSFYL